MALVLRYALAAVVVFFIASLLQGRSNSTCTLATRLVDQRDRYQERNMFP
jgi:hypothetical protein